MTAAHFKGGGAEHDERLVEHDRAAAVDDDAAEIPEVSGVVDEQIGGRGVGEQSVVGTELVDDQIALAGLDRAEVGNAEAVHGAAAGELRGGAEGEPRKVDR